MESIQLINTVFLAISLVYFFFYMYMLSHEAPPKSPLEHFSAVTILVALRNEQESILACCKALNALDYPHDKIEILMLNDNSDDNSRQIISDYIKDKNQFQLIDITGDKDGLRGKINVLAQGMDISSNEFIFVTDADCQPQPGWIKTLLEYYDERTGLISGFTILDSANPGILDKLQKIDMIYLQSMAVMASNIQRPVTVIGNNITFRRSVYESVGGFKKIGFTVTEDHALMKAILDQTDYNVHYIRDNNGLVLSRPTSGFKNFIEQRRRWMIGGLKARPFAFLLVGLSFLIHSAMVVFTLSGQWNMTTGTAIGLILGIDYFLLKRSLKDLQIKINTLQFLTFEIFYILYTHILIFLLFFSRKVKWKGRKYSGATHNSEAGT